MNLLVREHRLNADGIPGMLPSRCNGITNRITCKGFSNTVPVVSNANIEEQRKNMRVEVVFRK